jgi:hypothetical protein
MAKREIESTKSRWGSSDSENVEELVTRRLTQIPRKQNRRRRQLRTPARTPEFCGGFHQTKSAAGKSSALAIATKPRILVTTE